MRIRDIRRISEFISLFCEEDDIELTDWLTDNLDSAYSFLNETVAIDILFDELCDFKTKDFSKLVSELENEIEKSSPINRIVIEKQSFGVIVKQNEFGKDVKRELLQSIYNKFETIENLDKMQKGLFYEQFCSYFLEDIGLESEVTRASNDKGIDIFAKYKTKLNAGWGHLVFNDYVYLLGQAKFYNNVIDTPVIRKLVGDALLLRFDQLEYIDVAHNAIHLIVFSHKGFNSSAMSFAERNKVMLMDTKQMISILATHEEPESSSALSYLDEYIINNT